MHAELTWNGARWAVRDLGSRNGTFVAGVRVEPGSRVELEAGVELAFADESLRFCLSDASPPHLLAIAATMSRIAEGTFLSLPDDDEPSHAIYPDRDGGWLLETASAVRPIEDGEPVVAGGRSWRISLPGQLAQTRAEGAAVSVEGAELRFSVSRDEEHVELRIATGTTVIEVEPRAHHALLLALARERLRDAQNPGLSAAEHGWVHREELARMLAVEPELITLWIHRARKQLSALGLPDAAWIIERRSGATQLRIGAARLVVAPL